MLGLLSNVVGMDRYNRSNRDGLPSHLELKSKEQKFQELINMRNDWSDEELDILSDLVGFDRSHLQSNMQLENLRNINTQGVEYTYPVNLMRQNQNPIRKGPRLIGI